LTSPSNAYMLQAFREMCCTHVKVCKTELQKTKAPMAVHLD
jgi:hypothetical protein